MFTITFINWILDIVNLNIEARMTLIDDPETDIDTKYENALRIIFHNTAVQAMLYSYMVRLIRDLTTGVRLIHHLRSLI